MAVHINGIRADSIVLAGDDAEGTSKTVKADLAMGDVVDLILSPKGEDGSNADGCDGTAFSMTLNVDPDGGGGGGGGDPNRLADLQNVAVSADGVFGATLPDGLTADIEYSTDLINWEVIATDATGAIQETDAGRQGAPRGFYRAKTE